MAQVQHRFLFSTLNNHAVPSKKEQKENPGANGNRFYGAEKESTSENTDTRE